LKKTSKKADSFGRNKDARGWGKWYSGTEEGVEKDGRGVIVGQVVKVKSKDMS